MQHESVRIIREEHAALSAMLRSMLVLVQRGPADNPERFFDVLRAMLFYIDEFPERQHHPKESDLLFPRVARMSPDTMHTIVQLENDHARGEASVRELQHLLLAWELMGENRRQVFEDAAKKYVDFYLEHMRLEETLILPAAQKLFNDEDWQVLDRAFIQNKDILSQKHSRDPAYDRLFSRIVMLAPAPIGVGDS
jgi:hemerythrin-like domain-containing protein